MPNLRTTLANCLWYLSCLPVSVAFGRAMRDVAETQERLLLRLLRSNAETEIGRRYGFGSLRSVAAYQARVPLSTYEDYEAYIERIAAGELNILTAAPITLLELTSGSVAPSKLIPYGLPLKNEFQRAIAPWIVNLYGHYPTLLRGQAYWSVTPVTQHQRYTKGGIPIGFEEDSEYFGSLQRYFIQSIMAVPPQVRWIEQMESFRYVTLLFLLRSRSLALISVWNPTFLTLLMERLPTWGTQLAADIAQGTLTPPLPLPPALHATLASLNKADQRRAQKVRAALPFLAANQPATAHTLLWPHLQLISCWKDGNAARYAQHLARLFPQAHLQAKGLIATEGFVSFPLIPHQGAALAITSHFFEFLPTRSDTRSDDFSRPPTRSDDFSRPLLAHQLEQGKQYEVVLTTGGGLYRYRMHDLVEVVGYMNQGQRRGQVRGLPLLRFIGKRAYISDWFGEKVNQRHVEQLLDDLLRRHGIEPAFIMVACAEELAPSPPRPLAPSAYTLFIELADGSDELLRQVGAGLEQGLLENFHYRYCRDLGQLGAVRVFRIAHSGLERYLAVCQSHGQRAGDIKPVALHRMKGWEEAFEGRVL